MTLLKTILLILNRKSQMLVMTTIHDIKLLNLFNYYTNMLYIDPMSLYLSTMYDVY